MSLGKSNIISNIRSKTQLSNIESAQILEYFLKFIKDKSINSRLKVSNFGVFYRHKSPSRIGRNPKTKIEYPIAERYIFKFQSSNKIKKILN